MSTMKSLALAICVLFLSVTVLADKKGDSYEDQINAYSSSASSAASSGGSSAASSAASGGPIWILSPESSSMADSSWLGHLVTSIKLKTQLAAVALKFDGDIATVNSYVHKLKEVGNMDKIKGEVADCIDQTVKILSKIRDELIFQAEKGIIETTKMVVDFAKQTGGAVGQLQQDAQDDLASKIEKLIHEWGFVSDVLKTALGQMISQLSGQLHQTDINAVKEKIAMVQGLLLKLPGKLEGDLAKMQSEISNQISYFVAVSSSASSASGGMASSAAASASGGVASSAASSAGGGVSSSAASSAGGGRSNSVASSSYVLKDKNLVRKRHPVSAPLNAASVSSATSSGTSSVYGGPSSSAASSSSSGVSSGAASSASSSASSSSGREYYPHHADGGDYYPYHDYGYGYGYPHHYYGGYGYPHHYYGGDGYPHRADGGYAYAHRHGGSAHAYSVKGTNGYSGVGASSQSGTGADSHSSAGVVVLPAQEQVVPVQKQPIIPA